MQDTDDNALADSIESGAYYKQARRWYSELFHAPIAERSYYIFVILLALINGYFAIHSFFSVFPLATAVPFTIYSYDTLNELPRIKRISTSRNEDRNVAVMKYFLRNYVINRESYNLNQYELRYRNVWSESSAAVFDRYKAIMDASNPYSPYRLYTNRQQRDIDNIAVTFERGADLSHAQVVFDAYVLSILDGTEVSHSKWQADITYRYTDFKVDQSLDEHAWVARLFGLTGKQVKASGEKREVVPMTFRVTDYQVKELLE